MDAYPTIARSAGKRRDGHVDLFEPGGMLRARHHTMAGGTHSEDPRTGTSVGRSHPTISRRGFLALGAAHLAAPVRDHGYVEGKNITIEYRWAEGKYERLPALAAELVRLPAEVIITQGTPAALAAKQATPTIPIVMAIVGDPVKAGVVASLARPGANVTGSSFFMGELNARGWSS